VLRTALETAVKWDLARVNVAVAVEKPRVARPEIAFLSPEDVRTLLAAAGGDRYRTLYLLAISTGLRPGELFALRWSDIDVKAGKIVVTHTLDPETLLRAEVKTRRGRRTVDISPMIAAELLAHRARMLEEKHPHGWVFPNTDGGPIRLSNLTRKNWKPLLVKAWGGRIDQRPKKGGGTYAVAIPDRDFRLYDLRHTAATLMIAAGVHVKVISERMGHASVAFTMDVYGHLTDTLGSEAAIALDRFFAAG